tara:strand:- start:232 stop:453 length:222 start_codon:yes stop_codon:yes gene_type:complete
MVNAKWNEVGAGEKPRLGRTDVLTHGPARPAAQNSAMMRVGKAKADGGGNKGASVPSRQTPRNPKGHNASVQP